MGLAFGGRFVAAWGLGPLLGAAPRFCGAPLVTAGRFEFVAFVAGLFCMAFILGVAGFAAGAIFTGVTGASVVVLACAVSNCRACAIAMGRP